MKTYWSQVETKNVLPTSAINGILNELCVKNKIQLFQPSTTKRLSFSSPIFQKHPFPSFSGHCSLPNIIPIILIAYLFDTLFMLFTLYIQIFYLKTNYVMPGLIRKALWEFKYYENIRESLVTVWLPVTN